MTFTLEEVILILKNMGLDDSCPACMETAFCGSTSAMHECGLESDVEVTLE